MGNCKLGVWDMALQHVVFLMLPRVFKGNESRQGLQLVVLNTANILTLISLTQAFILTAFESCGYLSMPHLFVQASLKYTNKNLDWYPLPCFSRTLLALCA